MGNPQFFGDIVSGGFYSGDNPQKVFISVDSFTRLVNLSKEQRGNVIGYYNVYASDEITELAREQLESDGLIERNQFGLIFWQGRAL